MLTTIVIGERTSVNMCARNGCSAPLSWLRKDVPLPQRTIVDALKACGYVHVQGLCDGTVAVGVSEVDAESPDVLEHIAREAWVF